MSGVTPEQLLAIDESLDRLETEDHLAGELVSLRYFAGLSLEKAADMLGISCVTAYRHWAYARAWLRTTLLEASE